MKDAILVTILMIASSSAFAQTKQLNCSNAIGSVKINIYDTTESASASLNKAVLSMTRSTMMGPQEFKFNLSDLNVSAKTSLSVKYGVTKMKTSCKATEDTVSSTYVVEKTFSKKDGTVMFQDDTQGETSITETFLCEESVTSPWPCK